jgi:hypothetical protein
MLKQLLHFIKSANKRQNNYSTIDNIAVPVSPLRYRDGQPMTCSSRKLGELKVFYKKTDVYVIDEINATSAENLT